MNRKLLLQVTAPTLVIGSLLCAACLVSAWYINRLQANLATILQRNKASLHDAYQLEVKVCQLRFHAYVYLVDPHPEELAVIAEDQREFEKGLEAVRASARTPEERQSVERISDAYRTYQHEYEELRSGVAAAAYRRPGTESRTGGGIASWLEFRAGDDGLSLCSGHLHIGQPDADVGQRLPWRL